MIRLSKPEQRLVAWLRLIAVIDGIALVAVVMPRAWMALVHEWLGLGAFPSEPIVGYLARSTSLLYGFLGLFIWVLASDPRKYARLITLFGWSATSWAGMLLFIDTVEGLPAWWRYTEWLCVLLLGQSVLILQRRATAQPSAAQPRRQVVERSEQFNGR